MRNRNGDKTQPTLTIFNGSVTPELVLTRQLELWYRFRVVVQSDCLWMLSKAFLRSMKLMSKVDVDS